MEEKELKKNIKAYAKYYRILLNNEGASDIEQKMQKYEARLTDLYNSKKFEEHNIYPSTNVAYVYSVIATCLELKEQGYEDSKIIPIVEKSMEGRWNVFVNIIKFIDLFPGSFSVVRKWNKNDHRDRVKDQSITYDYFELTKDKVEYKISKCMYVEMFNDYGIRPLCKIFCDTDRIMYGALTRHVNYTRHSDLSDGDTCHDEIEKK